MNPLFERDLLLTRRQFFGDVGLRAGGIALGLLMGRIGARHRRCGRAASSSHAGPAALPAEGEVAHLCAHERRAVPDGPLGLQAPAREYFDQELPDSVRNGQRITTMTSGQTRFPVAPSKFKFCQARSVRAVDQRVAAAHGEDRRRHRAGQVGSHQRDQP